jgi:hypothetical protein
LRVNRMSVGSGMFPSQMQAYEECRLIVGTLPERRNIIGKL